jgi:competence ComEA-like helix-hairpin-helix protein
MTPFRLLNALFHILLPITLLLFHPSPASAAELAGQLNINSATAEELQMLPSLDEDKAAAIVEYRRRHGPFTDISILVAAGTIDLQSFETIRPYLKTEGTSALHYIGRNPAGDRVLSSHPLRTPGMTGPGRMRTLPDDQYFSTLLDLIAGAREQIDIGMFCFRTTDSPGNRAGKIVSALIEAQGRGVRIRVLLEKSAYDDDLNTTNQKVAGQLAANGITVVFDSPRTTMHAKLIVIDRRYVLVGSHNLTHSALTDNHEFSLLLDSPELADEVLRYLESIPLENR